MRRRRASSRGARSCRLCVASVTMRGGRLHARPRLRSSHAHEARGEREEQDRDDDLRQQHGIDMRAERRRDQAARRSGRTPIAPAAISQSCQKSRNTSRWSSRSIDEEAQRPQQHRAAERLAADQIVEQARAAARAQSGNASGAQQPPGEQHQQPERRQEREGRDDRQDRRSASRAITDSRRRARSPRGATRSARVDAGDQARRAHWLGVGGGAAAAAIGQEDALDQREIERVGIGERRARSATSRAARRSRARRGCRADRCRRCPR